MVLTTKANPPLIKVFGIVLQPSTLERAPRHSLKGVTNCQKKPSDLL